MKSPQTFWINLRNGIVHAMETQHVRCRLAWITPEHLHEVRLSGPISQHVHTLLAAIAQTIPDEVWSQTSSGAPRQKFLRVCVWCMAWLDELS